MKVYIAHWFPRTKAHLDELYEFFLSGTSHLPLDEGILKANRNVLDIKHVEEGFDDLAFISIETDSGVFVRIYSDGFVLLWKDTLVDTCQTTLSELENYYSDRLERAFVYLFSIGAPITKYGVGKVFSRPQFVVLDKKEALEEDLYEDFGVIQSKDYSEKNLSIYKTNHKCIIHSSLKEHVLRHAVEEMAFLHIVSEQLHSFIDLHREIWTQVDDIRKSGEINGQTVERLVNSLGVYVHTCAIVESRIRKISIYIDSREGRLSAIESLSNEFSEYLKISYSSIGDMLKYVTDLWGVTKNYVEQTHDLIMRIEKKIRDASFSNLTIVATIGAGAVIIELLTSSAPEVSATSIVYLIVLGVVGYLANVLLKRFYKNRKYKIDIEEEE